LLIFAVVGIGGNQTTWIGKSGQSRVSGWTLLFCGQKSSQKSPRLPANPTVFGCSEAAQKKLAARFERAFGPGQLSWLKQFFAFPASEHPKTGIC
jgi:hypothetical protein